MSPYPLSHNNHLPLSSGLELDEGGPMEMERMVVWDLLEGWLDDELGADLVRTVVAIQCFPIRLFGDGGTVCSYGEFEDSDKSGEQEGV